MRYLPEESLFVDFAHHGTDHPADMHLKRVGENP
jgi:hypothetical protein